MATPVKIKYEDFENSVKRKIDNYVKSKNLFSGFKFQEFSLVRTQSPNIHENEHNKEKENIKMSQYARAIDGVFQKVMGPFEAGVKHSKIYETIYAYANPEDKKYKDYIYLKKEEYSIIKNNEYLLPVNLDEEYTEKLLIELCRKATEIKDNNNQLENINYSRFFLLGDMGIGKTAFLNNLFSRYHNDLKEDNIFWIRVDLTKNYLRKLSILESLIFQLTRVFRGHYFDSLSEEEKKKLKIAISKHFTVNGILDTVLFNQHYNIFCQPYQKEEVERFDKRVEQGIKDYVEKTYGVIYIFDGLDRIESDKEWFTSKLDDVKNILSSEKFRGVFIFVMRHISHQNLESLLPAELAGYTNLRKGNKKAFEVIPPKLEEIINKRINLLFSNQSLYFENIKNSLYPSKFGSKITDEEKKVVEEIGKKISQHRKDHYETYLNVFLMFLYNGITKVEPDFQNWERREVFRELKNLFNCNYRKLLEIIRSSNRIFLEVLGILRFEMEDIFEIGNAINTKEMESYSNYKRNLDNIMKKSYIILDDLLLRNSPNFRNPYQYEYSKDNKIKWVENITSEKVPHLYNLYYAVNVTNKVENQYCLLLKIRVLQYISKHDDIREEKTLIDFLHNKFHYSEDRTEIAFRELLSWGLIASVCQSDNTLYNYVYKLSRSGEYHLETLIYEFSYIRIIIEDILVPEKICSFFNYVKNNKPNIKRVEEIIRQFPKMINFISMVKAIEQKEMKDAQMDEKEKAEWRISDKLYDRTIEIFSKILWRDDRSLNLLDNVLSDK